MRLCDKIRNREVKLSVIGLGYVGLPIAYAFSGKADVIAYDVNADKINLYKSGIDPTNEIGGELLRGCGAVFTSDESLLRQARFHIAAVPTPIMPDKTPDLRHVIAASETIGRNLAPGSVVVYESTVYPGTTEEICVPVLEEYSGLKCGVDFKVGYSPERINPGDKERRVESIVKVVSGMDGESLSDIAEVYKLIVEAGVYKAESIRTAEAAKVIENAQRDVNIAFMNELSIIFHKMGIHTSAVLDAAKTKWNFLDFTPGLVGGHCIGVDPYYLTYKAEQLGYHSQVILSGRKINDEMGKYIAENAVKLMANAGIAPHEARVAVLGVTFKENCPDIRNSKVIDIINELNAYNIRPYIADPVADGAEVHKAYGLNLSPLSEINGMDAVIAAVAHEEYKRLTLEAFAAVFKKDAPDTKRIFMDIKSMYDKKEFEKQYTYWSL